VAVKIVSPTAFEFSAIVANVISPSAPPSAVPGEDQAVIAASATLMFVIVLEIGMCI